MSALTFAPAVSSRLRAALVLLVTLLVHALLLERVPRMRAGAEDVAPTEAAVVAARLLPPAAPRAAPSPPAPASASRPRPLPADRKEATAVPPAVTPVQAGAHAEIEPATNARVEDAPSAAQEAVAAAEADADAAVQAGVERSANGAAAVEPAELEASGAALRSALAMLPEPRAALPLAAHYVYRTTNSELRLASGTTTVTWSLGEDGRYRLRLATSALGVTVLELESQGALGASGLAPERYTETRLKRGTVAANFDRDGRRVTFSARSYERPLTDGLQDRISFQFQLMLLGQARPEQFRAGAQTVLWMAGRDDVSAYRFRSGGHDTTETGVGEQSTVRIERVVAGDSDARMEVWLAPALSWLPVRLRFTDRYGRVTESVLESMATP
jgi:hypothetical protein